MIPYKIVGTTNYRPYVAFFVTATNVLAFIYMLVYAFLGRTCRSKKFYQQLCAQRLRDKPVKASLETLIDGIRSISSCT